MRKRGQGLDSPEANFIFGGPDNEQIYATPDDKLMPYDAPTAAIDSLTAPTATPVDAGSIISRRDELTSRIETAVPDTKRIEEERKRIADGLNNLTKS